MKTIGETNDGLILVEMSDGEHAALGRLADVISGHEMRFESMNHAITGFDLAKGLERINIFTEMLRSVRRLKYLAESVESELMEADDDT